MKGRRAFALIGILTLMLLFLALALFPLLTARADTFTVTNANPGGIGSLRSALVAANSNAGHDTTTFADHVRGTIVLTDALPTISDGLTISGPGAPDLAISGANAFRVFDIASSAAVTITGLTIREGKATGGYGGGIYSEGDLRLEAVDVISNSAGAGGGGLLAFGGTTVLSGTRVCDNSAPVGGGIYGGGDLRLLASEVSTNTATGLWPEGMGGGLLVIGATFIGSRIHSNSAAYGGGVFVYQESMTLNGTRIYNNSAADRGGGLYVDENTTATLRRAHIYDNSTLLYGGGIYAYGGTVTLNSTHVYGNSATETDSGYGGGIFVGWGGIATVTGGHIYENSAAAGGGVYVYDSTANLSQTDVVDNSARQSGGGLFVSANGSLAATDGCIVNNSDTAVDRSSGGLVATGNWWGAANGPSGAGQGGGDSVAPGIGYGGYQTLPPSGCATLQSDLTLRKTAVPPVVAPGQIITYTLAVTNTGPHVARYVTISDTIPISVTLTRVISRGLKLSQSAAGNHYTWSITDLGMLPGAVGIITATGILSDPLPMGAFTNTARIRSATSDPVPENDVSNSRVTVGPVALSYHTYLPVIVKH